MATNNNSASATGNSLEQTLSAAITRAIQETFRNTAVQPQAASGDDSNARGIVVNDSRPTTTRRQVVDDRVRDRQQSHAPNRIQTQLLPSIFGGSGISFSGVTGKRKRSSTSTPKAPKVYTKDVVCIPPVETRTDISIPRGTKRTELAEKGLIGKVSINTAWNAEQVAREITSVFSNMFELEPGQLLSFEYLGVTKGTKKLAIPKTSSSFKWNAPEVISLCAQGCLYVMAKLMPKKIDSDDEEDLGVETITTGEDTSADDVPDSVIFNTHPLSNDSTSFVNTTNSCYRSYVDMLSSDAIEISDDEDENLQNAIQNSLEMEYRSDVRVEESHENVEEVMQNHVAKVMQGQPSDTDVSKNIINVRRKHVFEDGLGKINRKRFNPTLPLSVRFGDELGLSEGAVDLGGPTREFLRLAIEEAYSSNCFGGSPTSKVVVLNQEAKRQNLYFQIGRLLAISLCNGGGVGRCLSSCVYNFIVYGESNCKPTIEDIQEYETRMILTQISSSENEVSFNNAVRSDATIDVFSQAGYHGLPKFENKDTLINELCQFFVIDKARTVLEQFKKGLQTLEIADLLRQHPSVFRPYFCYTSAVSLTASSINQLFKPCMAEESTRYREKEELIFMHWRDYLQECEGHTDSASSGNIVTLPVLLAFATGANEIPPLGFKPAPAIHFWNDVRPRSNTCANILFLPRYMDVEDVEFEKFQEMMDDAILNSPTFGKA